MSDVSRQLPAGVPLSLGCIQDGECRADPCICIAADRASRPPFRWFHPSRWRHKKRGTSYNVLTGTAEAQCATGPINEGDHVTVYKDEGECGNWYVRKTAEFQDGRFERIDLIEGWPTTAPERAKPDARNYYTATRLLLELRELQARPNHSGDNEIDLLAAALAEARRAERERCANVADVHAAGSRDYMPEGLRVRDDNVRYREAKAIASDIRALHDAE